MFHPLWKLLILGLTVVAHAQAPNMTTTTTKCECSLVSRAPPGPKTVIIQLFGWSWSSIATECSSFIGPAGYGYIQVSPPAEHISGSQWWTDYQPVSYNLNSKRGNRAQFSAMISTCHAAGVKVIVDTLFNHMAGIESGTGVAGSSFTHYNYPGIYQTQDFHHCGLTSGDDIVDYNDRAQVQICELVNLSDLKTESELVRARLAQYANDLISLGADGLRLDAAKHIASGDIANILSRLTQRPYITQEIIFGSGEPITPSEYTINGDVQEFRYTYTLRSAFLSDGIAGLQNLENRGWVSGSQAQVFVNNHDTERYGTSLNYKSPSNTYVSAIVFGLAHPYGTPSILSGYTFADNDVGAPNGGAGTCSGSGGTNGWQCQHRWVAIAGMVGFRNTVGTSSISNWVSPQSQRIAFGRGLAGFVVINNSDSSWTATFTTSLPAGVYCNIISGPLSSGACTGAAVIVSGGSFNSTISARNSLAIHINARSTSPPTTTPPAPSPSSTPPSTSGASVTFQQTATTVLGESIYLVGSSSQLGAWAPADAILMSPSAYPIWTLTVTFPANTAISYKFIRKAADGSVAAWESDPNRSLTTGASESSTTITSSFR